MKIIFIVLGLAILGVIVVLLIKSKETKLVVRGEAFIPKGMTRSQVIIRGIKKPEFS